MREMFPQFFTKKAKEERAKAPKEPICPKMPSEPQPPNKYLYNNRQSLTITDDSGNGSDVTIPFSKIMELRSQINVKDECINIKITSSSSYCGGGSFESEVDAVYFEWYEEVENPRYQKDFEKYQEKVKKYYLDQQSYLLKKQEYIKNMKVYKKELKAYRLQQMKEQKDRLDQQIEKEESKLKKK